MQKKQKTKKQRDLRVSKNCKSNSRNWARRHHPTHGQGMLEYLSSIDSFARSENINLKALSFATKKEEDAFGRMKLTARKTELLPKFHPRKWRKIINKKRKVRSQYVAKTLLYSV